MKKVMIALATVVVFLAGSQMAGAAVDYSGVTDAVEVGPLVLAIAALAAVKMSPGAVKWGFNKLIGWFR